MVQGAGPSNALVDRTTYQYIAMLNLVLPLNKEMQFSFVNLWNSLFKQRAF